mgnify:CR=1 FL=1
MAEKWTKESVLNFLRENPLASMAVNGEDYPISSLVLFYADDGFNVYFGTGRESFKAKALLKDPKISFSCWKSGAALMQWSGKAEEVTDKKEAGDRMDDVAKETRHLPDFWPPLLGIWKSAYILFKVKTDFLRVLDLDDLHIKEVAPKFTDFRF